MMMNLCTHSPKPPARSPAHYAKELERERTALERVAADLKALVSYEQLERQRLEEELAQERAEGQAHRSALRVQLRRLQSELDAARVDSLPHD